MAATVATIAVVLGAAATPALADTPVISATIFPGSQGAPTSRTVSESELASCPLYDGPASISTGTLGGEIGIPPSSWTLSTLVTCGLQAPQSDVTAVQVVNAQTNETQVPLTAAQVFDATVYPNGGGALPTISDIGNGQLQYVRPGLGSSDDNAADLFTISGQPIPIYVYENEPPLNVTIAQSPVSGTQTATSERVTLTAAVSAADGTAVDPTQLTYRWMVGGSAVSTAASPTLSFASGATIVSLQVSSGGTGGTASVTVSYSPKRSSGGHQGNQGAGHRRRGNPSGSPRGGRRSRGASPSGRPSPRGGAHRGRGPGQTTSGRTRSTPQTTANPGSDQTAGGPTRSTPQTGNRGSTPPPSSAATPSQPATTTTTITTTTTTTATTTTPTTTTQTPPRHRHPRRRHNRRRAAGRPGEREVSGRLVADVTPLPPDSSPLVRRTPNRPAAPAGVRAAQTSGPIPGWVYAVIAIAALAGAGAWYERRGGGVRSLRP